MKANTVELGQYPIKSLPVGEFVRFQENGPVWVRGDYCHSSRRYSLTRFNDVNRETFKRGDIKVFAGFTF